jgi:hypothetical protein
VIWLAWRQFRPQALAGAGLAAVLAAWIVSLGVRLHDYRDGRIADCTAATCDAVRREFVDTFAAPVDITGAALLAVPALIGIFWGAPLVAREVENGTHRLAWSQSVTRTRWLAVKLALVALAAALLTGVLAGLLSWAAQPYDAQIGSRFGAMTFGARGVVPLAYAVFAFLAGTTTGLLVRRTLPAMALTLIAVAAVQVVMPLVVRDHLLRPVQTSIAADTAARRGVIDGLGMSEEGPTAPVEIFGYQLPGAWVLSGRAALVRGDGRPVTAADLQRCETGAMPGDFACLARSGGVHFDVTYHPASRYWPFQWIETAILLALGALLAGVSFRRISHAAG